VHGLLTAAAFLCIACGVILRADLQFSRKSMGDERIIGVIPARMGSSRFPGKPLATLLGRSMIEHVVRRAEMCQQLDAVVVTTCDEEIRCAAGALDTQVIMTSPTHERATDRVAEAAQQLDASIIVMIQADEPMITPRMITAALSPMLADGSINCVNLAVRILDQEDYLNPNTIKVVMDTNWDALYFSRAPIPAVDFSPIETPFYKQVCVIPFRREFLAEFARLTPTPLERAESIDMLRIIEHGGRIRLVETEVETHAVDTPDDLHLVELLMKDDPLLRNYNKLTARAEAV
jgi:3-deoxy-manno-octulosonate cytidylyltransferase (CMP-KDO synthetase)